MLRFSYWTFAIGGAALAIIAVINPALIPQWMLVIGFSLLSLDNLLNLIVDNLILNEKNPK